MSYKLSFDNLSTAGAIGLIFLVVLQLVVAMGIPVLIAFALLRYLGAC